MVNGKKLRMLRQACGWTPTQLLAVLAKEHGVYVHPSSLSAYELDRVKNPPTEVLIALAKIYDVKLEDLLTPA